VLHHIPFQLYADRELKVEGVKAIHPLGKVTEGERVLIEAALPELVGNIEKVCYFLLDLCYWSHPHSPQGVSFTETSKLWIWNVDCVYIDTTATLNWPKTSDVTVTRDVNLLGSDIVVLPVCCHSGHCQQHVYKAESDQGMYQYWIVVPIPTPSHSGSTMVNITDVQLQELTTCLGDWQMTTVSLSITSIINNYW